MKAKLLAAFAATTMTAVLFAQQPAPSAPPPQPPPGSVVADSPHRVGTYVGVASCVNSGCHGSTQPLNTSRVLQNEYFTWLNSGRHAQAYNVLFNARSARIARNMRLQGKAHQAQICLRCHSTIVPASAVTGKIDPEDGVQCEACHGPAGGWRDEHTQAGWTHQQSVERGLVDLRSVPQRASACMACHVGDETREVDHELIASGHPQLPFELDNYSESMPPHWKANDTHGVRAWAVGQAVAFTSSLVNLSRHARGAKWPEFSDMSCYNCHHSLKNGSWRQERGWNDRAGLPAWSGQRWAVLRLILDRAAPGSRAKLDPLVAQISTGVARMNDPSGVASAADQARAITDDAIAHIDAARWSDADVRSMIATIADNREYLLRSDVHAAEQTALSIQALAATMTRGNPRLAKSALMDSIDSLFNEVRDRDDYDPQRFVAKLQAVKSAL